jgi:hypothetical protein
VSSETAANLKLGIYKDKIVFVPVLVGITENKIKRALQFLYKVMRIGKPGIDIFRKPCLFEVFKRYFVPPFINVNCYQLPPVLLNAQAIHIAE